MIEIKSKLNYGEEVIDKISGFEGKIVAITKWQNDCLRVAVQPMIDKEGKLQKAEWIAEADIISNLKKMAEEHDYLVKKRMIENII